MKRFSMATLSLMLIVYITNLVPVSADLVPCSNDADCQRLGGSTPQQCCGGKCQTGLDCTSSTGQKYCCQTTFCCPNQSPVCSNVACISNPPPPPVDCNNAGCDCAFAFGTCDCGTNCSSKPCCVGCGYCPPPPPPPPPPPVTCDCIQKNSAGTCIQCGSLPTGGTICAAGQRCKTTILPGGGVTCSCN